MIIIKINNDNSDKNSNNEKIYKIENTPCTLGRSLKNNVIIDDDSISANHALIDSDEKGVFIRDLNSTNGIKKDNVLVDQHYIHEKTTFMLGEIQIEVIFDDEHLEKTRIITIPKEFYVNNNNKQKLNILLCLLISGLLIFLSQYFSAPLRKDDVIKILADFFGTVFIIVLSTLVLGVISKVHSKKYKFLYFMETLSIILTIFYLYNFLNSYFEFYVNHRVSTIILTFVYYSVLFLLALYRILSIFFDSERKKTITIFTGSLYIGIAFFFFLVKNLDERDLKFQYQASYELSPFSYHQKDYPFKVIKHKMEKSFDDLGEYRLEKSEEMNDDLDEYRKANP